MSVGIIERGMSKSYIGYLIELLGEVKSGGKHTEIAKGKYLLPMTWKEFKKVWRL